MNFAMSRNDTGKEVNISSTQPEAWPDTKSEVRIRIARLLDERVYVYAMNRTENCTPVKKKIIKIS